MCFLTNEHRQANGEKKNNLKTTLLWILCKLCIRIDLRSCLKRTLLFLFSDIEKISAKITWFTSSSFIYRRRWVKQRILCRIWCEKVNKNSEWHIKWKHNGTKSVLMWRWKYDDESPVSCKPCFPSHRKRLWQYQPSSKIMKRERNEIKQRKREQKIIVK